MRDLAYVIRNFIRFAYKVWKTRFVLIGGDTTIVPMREMVSYVSDKGNFGWDYVYANIRFRRSGSVIRFPVKQWPNYGTIRDWVSFLL